MEAVVNFNVLVPMKLPVGKWQMKNTSFIFHSKIQFVWIMWLRSSSTPWNTISFQSCSAALTMKSQPVLPLIPTSMPTRISRIRLNLPSTWRVSWRIRTSMQNTFGGRAISKVIRVMVSELVWDFVTCVKNYIPTMGRKSTKI